MRKIIKNTTNPIDMTRASASISNLAPKAAIALVNPQDPNGLHSGDIDGSIYASDAVKNQLKQDQFYKCAYCECCFNGDYGAVEHYRPKARYQNAAGDPYLLGYWWLAYDWNNLLYSCSECNTTYKRCLFPLEDKNQRDIANQSIVNEHPLLINPAITDPKYHIRFFEDFAVSNTLEGLTTICCFQLNDRPLLRMRRQQKWKCFKDDYDTMKGIESVILHLESRLGAQDPAVIELKDRLDSIKTCIKANYFSADKEYVGMFENQLNQIIL